MALLKWKHSSADLNETLKMLMSVVRKNTTKSALKNYLTMQDVSELAKYLSDVLDALFEIFATEEGDSTNWSGMVFQVLAHIADSLQQPRLAHLAPLLDDYVQNQFSAALVYKGLLTCLRHFTDLVPSSENHEPIRRCFRAMGVVFKIIVKSRNLFFHSSFGREESEAADSNTFRDSVKLLFDSFNGLLATKRGGGRESQHEDTVAATQAALLSGVTSAAGYLVGLLLAEDVADMLALAFTTAVERANIESSAVVSAAVLDALRKTISSPLFFGDNSRPRALLMPVCLLALNRILPLAAASLDVERQCSGLLGDLLCMLRAKESDDDFAAVETLSLAKSTHVSLIEAAGRATYAESKVSKQLLTQTGRS